MSRDAYFVNHTNYLTAKANVRLRDVGENELLRQERARQDAIAFGSFTILIIGIVALVLW